MSISQNFPSTRPSLNLNFARSQKLDPRITFTRSSTATYTGGDGLIKIAATDTPRFDFNATTGDCLGLLIEESRTNLITYSGIPSATWGINSSAVITYNSSTSPDGTTNVTQIAAAASIGSGVYQTFSLTSGTAYTYSLFVKAVSGSNTMYFGTVTGTNATVQVNTSTGVASLNSGSPTNITSTSYPNGWYRISFTFTAGVTATHSFVIYNLTANANTWLAYGAQVEAGAFPTSYIPTVASTVTRSADNASITGTNFSSWYNPSEGTLFAQFKSELSINNNIWSINNYPATTFAIITNYFRLLTLSNVIHTQYNVGGTNLYPQFSLANNNSQKVTQSYNINSSPIISALNGTIGTGSGNIYATSPGFNQLEFGKNTDQRTTIGKYTIAQLSYYPVRLSNSQLQTLTK